jgi:hypothetical protein
MPRPYSNDLRARVIEAIESGASRREAADRYELSASVVVLWTQRGAAPESADNRTKGDCSFRAADFAICPDCGGAMRRIAAVPRAANPQPFRCDTS